MSTDWTPANLPRLVVTREHLTGQRPDAMAQAAAAAERAARDGAHRYLAEPMVGRWRAMTDEERAEASRRAQAERERRAREAREAHARREREVWERHETVRERYTDEPVLRAVVELHCPSETWVDECAGCPDAGSDCCGGSPADWPCDTFLLIEGSA